MRIISSGMTIAKILELNPLAAQVLFRYGIRSVFDPCIANETLEQLSQAYQFDITEAIQELDEVIPIGSGYLGDR